MLTNVPIQVNRATRQVVLRHPNSIPCDLWRKVLKRTAPTSMGGIPTIGEVGSLDGEDEASYEFRELGAGRIVFKGPYQPNDGGNLADDESGTIYQSMVEALIECQAEPGDPKYFVADKNDILSVYLGAGNLLHYEVAYPVTPINIPPFSRAFALIPRQDGQHGR